VQPVTGERRGGGPRAAPEGSAGPRRRPAPRPCRPPAPVGLGALAEGERYGYDLAQRLAHAGLGRIKGGTLYPLLARLEAAGLVASRWQAGAQGLGRKYYTLTVQGRHARAAYAAAWATFVAHVEPLLQGQIPLEEGRSDGHRNRDVP